MHVYSKGTWTEGYLDDTPTPGRVRVAVHRQVALVRAGDQFFVRQPQVAMLASYLRMLGARRVARKVMSRRTEATRNDAWLSIGLGWCQTGPVGDPVVFVLTSGARGLERALVHFDLVFPASPGLIGRVEAGYFEAGPGTARWSGVPVPLVAALEPLVGWSPEEGRGHGLGPTAPEGLEDLIEQPAAPAFTALPPPPPPSKVCERHEAAVGSQGTDRPRFHCFGYGQYAKTQVIPNLGKRLVLDCVHEINPLQIGPIARNRSTSWDTSASPRVGERIVNAVVAGYHHTHASTAAELLDMGVRHVIVEKPIATDLEQLDGLIAAMARHPESRVHVAFQRRYSPFNAFLRSDLGGQPVSMAATVYEVPLPARHWYRWPVVGNAVVSNGCHWIDHFLYMNSYLSVTRLDATVMASQTVLNIEVENGASCSISLRHEGAPRRGVRDLCIFWNGDASVVVEDMRRYVAERGYRQLRSKVTHPYRALENMYGEFGRRIELDLPGDDMSSIRASAMATLELARLVDDAE